MTSLFSIALAALTIAAPDATRTVACPGVYDGHLQGVAIDAEGDLYWSFTVALVKTDGDGTLLRSVAVPAHHGDLWTEDGVLYAAVNYPLDEARPATRSSFIYAYDSQNLALRWKKAITEPREGVGALAMRDGHFFVASGRRIKPFEHNTVYEYDANCDLVATHTLASGRTYLGIQTMAYADGTWWFGCYGNPPETLRATADFTFETRFEFDCALGIAPLPGGGFIVGRGDQNAEGKHTGSVEYIDQPSP